MVVVLLMRTLNEIEGLNPMGKMEIIKIRFYRKWKLNSERNDSDNKLDLHHVPAINHNPLCTNQYFISRSKY